MQQKGGCFMGTKIAGILIGAMADVALVLIADALKD